MTVTSRIIAIEFPKLGASGEAVLLDRQAPETCDLIWEALPFEETAYHCIRCGKEVFALIQPLRKVPPPENRCMVPAPGALWFTHFPADYPYNPPGFVGDPRGTFDFILWYGSDSWAIDPGGKFVTGNHWAQIERGVEDFARACEQIWLSGTEMMHVRKAS
jgi:hypothetical protein